MIYDKKSFHFVKFISATIRPFNKLIKLIMSDSEIISNTDIAFNFIEVLFPFVVSIH